jgi:hypothetical protein
MASFESDTFIIKYSYSDSLTTELKKYYIRRPVPYFFCVNLPRTKNGIPPTMSTNFTPQKPRNPTAATMARSVETIPANP